MSKFIYKARKTPTEMIEGAVEAENIDIAIDKINQLGFIPIDVTPESVNTVALQKRSAPAGFSFGSQVSPVDVAQFIRQLHDMIDAGVPILRALTVVANQTKNPNLKSIVEEMLAFIQDGGNLSDAMAQHGKIFPPLFVNLVHSGELGGNLNIVLNRLSQFIEKDLETRSKVKSSMVYPLLILGMGFATIFVLLSFVVPRLTVMFEDMTEALPWPTVLLMGVSDIFAKFWWVMLAIVIIAVIFFRRFTHSEEGRLWLDQTKLRIPVVGNFIKEVEIGRFARTLATLLESGVAIVTALDAVWATLTNAVLKNEIKEVSLDVAGGMSLTNALAKCAYFPDIAMNMVAVGEESGRLEAALYKLADSFDRQSDRSVKMVTSLLEPVMILVVGLIVFFIVMAVILPIFKMNQIIR